MQITQRIYPVGERKPTVKEAVAAKMKVLKEFYVVNRLNKTEIEEQLWAAIKAHPESDYEVVLDQVSHKLIAEKLK